MLLTSLMKQVQKLFLLKSPNVSMQRQEEIFHLKRRLAELDICFSNLADRPSGVETETLLEISKIVAQNNELLYTINSERELVFQKLLTKRVGISLKILEEHHQFIVTMAHIFSGPYPCLRAYISNR